MLSCLRFACLAVPVLLWGCDGSPTPLDQADPPIVVQEGFSLASGAPGQSLPVYVSVSDQAGQLLKGVSVRWSVVRDGAGSAPDAVVTPAEQLTDAAGAARATITLGGAGRYRVTATATRGSAVATGSLQVDAIAGRESIQVQQEFWMVPAGVGAVPVRVADASGDPVANPALAWSSSDTTVVAVGANGVLSARKTGTATLTARDGDRAATTRVHVAPAFRADTVVSGHTQSCALHSGATFCWGKDYGVAAARVAGPQLRQLTAGSGHFCGLTAEGQAYCWGENAFGQLGDGTLQSRAALAPAAGDLRFRSLAAAEGSTCGITPEGRAFCWGRNRSGSPTDTARWLGTADTTAFVVNPTSVVGGRNFTSVWGGGSDYCGIAEDGLYCWGPLAAAPTAEAVGISFRQVAVRRLLRCGVSTAEEVFCWGSDTSGDGILGQLAPTTVVAPMRVAGDRKARTTSLGIGYACMVATDGMTLCWGNGREGTLGDGRFASYGVGRINAPSPMPVAGDVRFTALSAGISHTCGTATTGDVLCWGNAAHGRTGNPSAWHCGLQGCYPYPVPVLASAPALSAFARRSPVPARAASR